MPKPENNKSQYGKYSEYLEQSIRGNKTVGNHVSSLKDLNETLKKLNKEIEKCYETDENGNYKPIGEKRLNDIKKLYKLCDHFVSLAENDAMRNNMRGTLVHELHRILKRDEEYVNCLFANDYFPETFRRNIVTTDAFNSIKTVGARMSSRYPVTYTDENGQKVYGFFTADSHFDAVSDLNKLGLYGKAGIKSGSNITDRNCAMTRIANLLGVNDLIAESHPMTILDASDKEKKSKKDGIFMVTAKGISPKDIFKLDGYEKGLKDGLDFASVKKNIADMQILDYICGNIDRHLNNITYIFDELNTFVGIQGIDNDLSMGAIVPEKKTSHLPALSNMFVISESMANKVKDITEEDLEYVLKGLNLSEDEIKAAWKRTQAVQKRIENANHYKSGDVFKIGKLSIVDGDSWYGININSLCTHKSMDCNLFDYVCDVPDYVKELENKEKISKKVNNNAQVKQNPGGVSFLFSDDEMNVCEKFEGFTYAKATLTSLAYTQEVIEKNTRSIDVLIKRLEASATDSKTKQLDLESRTEEFNNVYKAAKAVRDWYQKYDENTDKSELKKLYETAAEACQKYINKHNPYSAIGKERQKTVTNIMEFIGTQGIMINEYHEYVAAQMSKKEEPAKDENAQENEKAVKNNGNQLI